MTCQIQEDKWKAASPREHYLNYLPKSGSLVGLIVWILVAGSDKSQEPEYYGLKILWGLIYG